MTRQEKEKILEVINYINNAHQAWATDWRAEKAWETKAEQGKKEYEKMFNKPFPTWTNAEERWALEEELKKG